MFFQILCALSVVIVFTSFTSKSLAVGFTKAIYDESQLSYADTPKRSSPFINQSAQLCQMALDPNTFKDRAYSTSDRLAFYNNGGLLNQGVCWWHSRFQRGAFYLTYFSPQLPKPNKQELAKILHDLKGRRAFVNIPGFQNFSDFSEFYQSDIQVLLNRWQIEDGFVKQKWLKGLIGYSKVTADNLWHKMNSLYQEVEVERKIAYQKLQMPGIVAHAWLVLAVVPSNSGFSVFAVDSNRPLQTLFYDYRYGDRFLRIGGYRAVPYSEEEDEYRDLNRVFMRECGRKIF